MKTAIVVGLPWLRSGTGRLMEMQIRHLHDFGFKVVFAVVPSSYTAGFETKSWQAFDQHAKELAADEVIKSGFRELAPIQQSWALAKARLMGRNAMHWALAPAHLSVPAERLQEIVANDNVRLIIANHVYTMPFVEKLRRMLVKRGRKVPVALITHDVQSHILLDRQSAAPWTRRIESEQTLLTTELAWLARCDGLAHASTDDLAFFKQRMPDHRHHLMLPAIPAMELSLLRGKQAPRRDLLYVGVDHFGNIESLKWYFNEVLPHLGDTPPKLTLIGSICHAASRFVPPNISTPWLEMIAGAEDLKPYYADAKVSLGATTSGRGISVKTIEAFAAGIAVAGTGLAFRGIPPAELQRAGIRGANGSLAYAELLKHLLTGNNWQVAAGKSSALHNQLFTPAHSAASFAAVLKPLGFAA